MTQYYLFYFPNKGQCHIKSLGLHKPGINIYKKDGESEEDFKKRATSEFEKLYNNDWASQLPDEFKPFEILSTKYLP